MILWAALVFLLWGQSDLKFYFLNFDLGEFFLCLRNLFLVRFQFPHRDRIDTYELHWVSAHHQLHILYQNFYPPLEPINRVKVFHKFPDYIYGDPIQYQNLIFDKVHWLDNVAYNNNPQNNSNL